MITLLAISSFSHTRHEQVENEPVKQVEIEPVKQVEIEPVKQVEIEPVRGWWGVVLWCRGSRATVFGLFLPRR